MAPTCGLCGNCGTENVPLKVNEDGLCRTCEEMLGTGLMEKEDIYLMLHYLLSSEVD